MQVQFNSKIVLATRFPICLMHVPLQIVEGKEGCREANTVVGATDAGSEESRINSGKSFQSY